jgi:hypothetical protein
MPSAKQDMGSIKRGVEAYGILLEIIEGTGVKNPAAYLAKALGNVEARPYIFQSLHEAQINVRVLGYLASGNFIITSPDPIHVSDLVREVEARGYRVAFKVEADYYNLDARIPAVDTEKSFSQVIGPDKGILCFKRGASNLVANMFCGYKVAGVGVFSAFRTKAPDLDYHGLCELIAFLLKDNEQLATNEVMAPHLEKFMGQQFNTCNTPVVLPFNGSFHDTLFWGNMEDLSPHPVNANKLPRMTVPLGTVFPIYTPAT